MPSAPQRPRRLPAPTPHGRAATHMSRCSRSGQRRTVVPSRPGVRCTPASSSTRTLVYAPLCFSACAWVCDRRAGRTHRNGQAALTESVVASSCISECVTQGSTSIAQIEACHRRAACLSGVKPSAADSQSLPVGRTDSAGCALEGLISAFSSWQVQKARARLAIAASDGGGSCIQHGAGIGSALSVRTVWRVARLA